MRSLTYTMGKVVSRNRYKSTNLLLKLFVFAGLGFLHPVEIFPVRTVTELQ